MSDGKGVNKPDCPLKLEVCYRSCYWWKDGDCTFSWDKIESTGAVETARTEHRCASCGKPIKKGDKFIRHILEFEWYPACLECTSRGVGLHSAESN